MTTSSVADDGQPQTKKSRVIPQAQAVPLALEPTLANEALRFHFYPSARQARYSSELDGRHICDKISSVYSAWSFCLGNLASAGNNAASPQWCAIWLRNQAMELAIPHVHSISTYIFVQVPHLQDSIDHDAGHEPLFSHQTFEDEEILGYAGLQLDIAMPTDTFVPILLHSYKEKRSPANDYVALLRKEFPAGLAVNQEELSQAVVRNSPGRLVIGECCALSAPCCSGVYRQSTRITGSVFTR